MANQPKTRRCSAATRTGRLEKARQFWRAAELIDTARSNRGVGLVDAYTTLCVHAGIAAADAICCARLGVHAQGQDHNEAVNLLASTDKAASRHLATLLGLKTRSAYSAQRSPGTDRSRARRAAGALIERAEQAA